MIIAFFSDIAWDSLYQRPQHLATRLARLHPVLWIEPVTLGRPVRFRPVLQEPGLYRITLPEFPLNARRPLIRRAAVLASRAACLRAALRAVQRAIVRKALRRLQVPGGTVVCLVENFLWMRIARALRAQRVVFDYIDDAFGFTAFPPYARAEWLAALRGADDVTATSTTLVARIREACPRDVVMIRNGAEFARFAVREDATRPTDLPDGSAPIVGYVGSVYPWLDFPLLDATIGSLQECQFVLIGPVHPGVADQVMALRRHRNFRALGVRPYTEVPSYLHCMHAGIIPFRRTLLTEAVNPVKLYEYSAARVPTVATNFSDDLRAFAEYVLIADSADAFARCIRTAVARREDRAFLDRLSGFGLANDWDARAAQFSRLLHTKDRES